MAALPTARLVQKLRWRHPAQRHARVGAWRHVVGPRCGPAGAARPWFRRLDVLGVLTNAPLLDGDGHVPGHAWERLSREAGVISGDDWAERLAVLAAEQRRRAELDDEEGCDLRAERRRRDANRAEALAAFVARLRGDLAAGADHVRAALVAANGSSTRISVTTAGGGAGRRRKRRPRSDPPMFGQSPPAVRLHLHGRAAGFVSAWG